MWISNFYRGIKEEALETLHDDEPDEAFMFADHDSEELLGQVGTRFSSVELEMLVTLICSFHAGSRGEEDLREVGSPSSPRAEREEGQADIPAGWHRQLLWQAYEGHARGPVWNRGHNEDFWCHEAGTLHLLPCPWLCTLFLCPSSFTFSGIIILI